MIKNKILFYTLITILSLPLIAFAQTSTELGPPVEGNKSGSGIVPGTPAGSNPEAIYQEGGLSAPATSAPSPSPSPSTSPSPSSASLKLFILAKRAGTNRLLGSVNLSLYQGDKVIESTLDDPPKPDGQAIFQVTEGHYKLIATRAGYKQLIKEFDVKGEKDLQLTLNLESDGLTPDPVSEYQSRLMALLYSSRLGQNANYNPLYGQLNPPLSQNGYILTSDQNATIPVLVKIQMVALSNSLGNFNIALLDSLNGNQINLVQSNQLSSNNFAFGSNVIYRTGCLRPNSRYVLRVANNQSTTQFGQLPYQEFQIGSVQAGYVDINIQPPLSVTYGGSNLANVQIQNLPINNQIQLGINCPSNYNYQTGNANWPTNDNFGPSTGTMLGQPPLGTTTWGDQSFNPVNFGNYRVEKAPTGGYYLVNIINPLSDIRPIKFVENSAGNGGLAFVPAESGAASTYSSQWYITTYTRNIDAQLGKCTTYINNLKNLPEFTKLSSAVQTDINQKLSNISIGDSSTIKTRLTACTGLKDSVLSSLRAVNSSITVPNYDITTTDMPNINLSKLSRVNLTPEEYRQIISGEILTNF